MLDDALADEIRATYHKLQPRLVAVSRHAHHYVLAGQRVNTTMTPHNLASYLLGWAEEVLAWDATRRNTGAIPAIPTSGYGEIAQKFYNQYEDKTYVELLQNLDEAVNKITTMVNQRSPADLAEVWYTTTSSGRDYTFRRLIHMNTVAPYRNAYRRLAKPTAAPGPTPPPPTAT